MLRVSRFVRWIAGAARDSRPGYAHHAPDLKTVHSEHADFVWKSLQRLGVRPSDLEDMHQEVFMVVHRKLCGYDPSIPITGWLFGICRKVAAAYRRKAYRRYEAAEGEWDKCMDEQNQDPEQAAEQAHARRQLAILLERLDLDKRAVFVMFEIDGLSCEEIAEHLGVPVGTVYSRLHTARKIFQKALEKMHSSASALASKASCPQTPLEVMPPILECKKGVLP